MVPELSYAGQASSGAVFSALDTVAQALANDSKTTGATGVAKGGAPDFDQLHSRHFSVLFEKALLKDGVSKGISPDLFRFWKKIPRLLLWTSAQLNRTKRFGNQSGIICAI